MKLTRIAVKGIAFIYFLFKFRSAKVAYYFSFYRVDVAAAKFLKTVGDKLVFVSTGNAISIQSLHLFRYGFQFMLKVLNTEGVDVLSSDPEGLMLRMDNTTIKVDDYSAIATVQEIYLEHLYKFHLLKKSVVVDIGMNVGYASLFFASMKEVVAVYSYEPFSGTFDIALQNFKLNPGVSPKINPFCYGISSSSGKITVPLLATGSTVGSTDKEFIKNNTFHSQSERIIEVEIKSIDVMLQEVRKNHPTTPLVLKIDCEGEEYSIIEKIQTTGQWQNISIILMEWHIHGPERLVKILTENNFACVNLPRLIGTGLDQSRTGMIYAFKV